MSDIRTVGNRVRGGEERGDRKQQGACRDNRLNCSVKFVLLRSAMWKICLVEVAFYSLYTDFFNKGIRTIEDLLSLPKQEKMFTIQGVYHKYV